MKNVHTNTNAEQFTFSRNYIETLHTGFTSSSVFSSHHWSNLSTFNAKNQQKIHNFYHSELHMTAMIMMKRGCKF